MNWLPKRQTMTRRITKARKLCAAMALNVGPLNACSPSTPSSPLPIHQLLLSCIPKRGSSRSNKSVLRPADFAHARRPLPQSHLLACAKLYLLLVAGTVLELEENQLLSAKRSSPEFLSCRGKPAPGEYRHTSAVKSRHTSASSGTSCSFSEQEVPSFSFATSSHAGRYLDLHT